MSECGTPESRQVQDSLLIPHVDSLLLNQINLYCSSADKHKNEPDQTALGRDGDSSIKAEVSTRPGQAGTRKLRQCFTMPWWMRMKRFNQTTCLGHRSCSLSESVSYPTANRSQTMALGWFNAISYKYLKQDLQRDINEVDKFHRVVPSNLLFQYLALPSPGRSRSRLKTAILYKIYITLMGSEPMTSGSIWLNYYKKKVKPSAPVGGGGAGRLSDWRRVTSECDRDWWWVTSSDCDFFRGALDCNFPARSLLCFTSFLEKEIKTHRFSPIHWRLLLHQY